ENATLVAKDLSQQRVQRELELAHDLQLKLLPSPLVIAARVDVAARCRQAESVGGDFYNLLNLPDDRIGVIIGDVTSHGFGAALIMALVMAASGIHAQAGERPTDVLQRIEQSLTDELGRTEMFLSLFYGVIDPRAGRLTYANAGHPHAFLVDTAASRPTRLDATRPPLGIAAAPGRDGVLTWRPRTGVVCLFTDGVAEAEADGERGGRFGEDRRLAKDCRLRIADCGLGNAEVVQGDALKLDWHALIESKPTNPQSAIRNPQFKVVGNIPFAITSPLIDKALTPPLPERIVFLVQREVADRLAARPGSRAYGALSVGVQATCRVQRLFGVRAGAFHPAPKVA